MNENSSIVVYLQTHVYRVGIASVSSKSQSLTVIVLPKIWKNIQHKYGSIDTVSVDWTENHQFICVYENQYIQLQITSDETLEELVEEQLQTRLNLLNQLLDEVEEVAKSSNSNEDEEQNSFLLSETTYRLFAQKQKKNAIKPWLFKQTNDNQKNYTTNKEKSLNSILKLLSLLQYSGFQNPQGALEQPNTDEMLTPLLHLRFMQEMQENYRHIRRSYVPKSEALETIRGQIDPFSAARSEISGETLVRCHYDEFEEGTVLMKVLVTALDIVTSGNWLTRYRQNDTINQDELNLANTQNKAFQLRRFLHSIPSFLRKMASQKASQIRLNRMTSMFEKALEYAKLILEDKSLLFMQTEQQKNYAWCWEIDMSDVWERILVSGLQKLEQQEKLEVLYFDQKEWALKDKPPIYPTKKIMGAFGGQSESIPDILVTTTTPNRNWILDAKYSYFWELKSSANPKYRDQMFRYLYLMSQKQADEPDSQWQDCRDSRPWADQLALIYATDLSYVSSKPQPSQGIYPWKNEDLAVSVPHLHQVALLFPNNHQDISSIQNWNEYLNRLAQEIETFLFSN